MFSKSEITELEKLYENIKDEKIETFLDEDEVELIKQNFGLAYHNIRNDVFVPKYHERPYVTIRLQRLNTVSFNLGEWLKQIAYTISYSPDMLIEVAYSFICRTGRRPEDKTYMFAAKGYATYRRKLSEPEELLEFADELGKLKESDLLSQTFWIADSQERFRRSGWIPSALVCNSIWITK